MIEDKKELQLYIDDEWEALYNLDKTYIETEKFRNYIIFNNKTYVLFPKHVETSSLLSRIIIQETTQQTCEIKLKYSNNLIAFDIVMKIIYGQLPKVLIPVDQLFEVLLIILELGKFVFHFI